MLHNHTYHNSQNKKFLIFSLTATLGYALIELIGGYCFNSLSLLADAGHMANDSLSLFLALFSLYVPYRIQQWLFLINSSSLVIVAIWILYEAIIRWKTPKPIISLPMLAIATVGLIMNILVARVMLKNSQHNLNIKAAYLHVLSDLFGSIIAIIAGISTYFLNWQWVDLVASVILSIFILKHGVKLSTQAIYILKQP